MNENQQKVSKAILQLLGENGIIPDASYSRKNLPVTIWYRWVLPSQKKVTIKISERGIINLYHDSYFKIQSSDYKDIFEYMDEQPATYYTQCGQWAKGR